MNPKIALALLLLLAFGAGYAAGAVMMVFAM